MTPLEKAKELLEKYIDSNDTIETWKDDIAIDKELSKQCALIAADEVLIEIRKIYDIYTEVNIISIYQYWEEVKNEINKL